VAFGGCGPCQAYLPVSPAQGLSNEDPLPTTCRGERRPASRAMLSSMKDARERLIAAFTAGERDYIRRELDQFFSSLPSVAEGFQLRVWRGGQQAGQPKISPSAKGLLDRGLMRLDTTQKPPRLFFTKPGLGALREMMTDRRPARVGN
jgi:hypothetical protein